MSRAQWIAIPILVAIPLLALAGVFGETWQTASDSGGNVEMRVEFPARFSYKMLNSISVTVLNRSDRTVDTLVVAFDPSYISNFSTVVFTPPIMRAYEVAVTDVRPGEARLVTAELQGEKYGRHQGWIQASDGGTDTARVTIHTIIFP